MKYPSMSIARILLTATIVLVLIVPSAAATFCAPPTPPAPGPPPNPPHPHCEPPCHSCQGSPCYLATGVYDTEATDLRIPTAGFPLTLSRRYESDRVVDGPAGVGWQTSLGCRVNYRRYLLAAPNTYQTNAEVVLPSGWSITFIENGAAFLSTSGRRDSLVRNADQTWTYTPPHSRAALRFNADGSLASMSDAFNNRIDYAYDTNGRLVEVVDAAGSGRKFTVTWGSDGRISSVNDSFSPARYVKYHYDSVNGTLIGVDDPITASLTNEYATRYEYTPRRFGPLLYRITDRWNRLITALEWDSSDRVHSYTDGEYNNAQPALSSGEKYTYTYNYAAQPPNAVKTHSLGSTQYSFGPTGLVTNQVTFDHATGLATSTTDEYGNITGLTYNAQGNVATRSVGGVTFTYTYDSNFPDQVGSVISNQPTVWPGFKYTYYPPGNPAAGALKEVKQVRKTGAEDVVAASLRFASA